jgi:hypothetical protein
MTTEFMETQINEKNARIQQLEEHIQRITQRDYTTAGTLQAMRDGMHEWTMGELESEDISTAQAEAIADICGFELTKEVEVEVTVQYSITVNVGPNEDVQDIIHDIDFDTVSYNDDKITWLSSSVDSVDF